MSFPAVGAPSVILPPLWAPGSVDLTMRPAALVPLWERSGHPREAVHNLPPSSVTVPCSWEITEIGPAFVLEDYGGVVFDLPLPIVDFADSQIGFTATMWLRMVSHDTGTGDVHFLSIEDGSGYRYRLRTQGTGGSMRLDVAGYSNPPDVTAPTQWAFVAVGMFAQSWGSAGNYVFTQVDGDYSQASVSGSHPSAKTLTKLILGNNGGEVDHKFQIADVRVFNRRLTRGEIDRIAASPHDTFSPYVIPSPIRADRPTTILTISANITPNVSLSAPAVTGAVSPTIETIIATPTISAPPIDRHTLVVVPIVATPTLSAPTVIPGATSVTVPSIAPTPTMTTVGLSRPLDVIAPDVTVSAPSLSGTLSITVSGSINPTPTLSAPTIALDASLAVGVIGPDVTVTAPTVTPGAVTLTPGNVEPTPTLSVPTPSWSMSLSVSDIAPTLGISAPAVGKSRIVNVPTITPTPTLSAPTVTPGAVTLTPGDIEATPTISPPSAEWLTSETIDAISPTPTLSAPSVGWSESVSVPSIAATPTIAAPTVTPGAVTLSPASISPDVSVSAPSSAWLTTATPGSISPDVSISAPTVTADKSVSLSSVAPDVSISAPGVITGGITVVPGWIAPDVSISAPSLAGVATLTVFGNISPDVTISAPTVAVGAAIARVWTVRPRQFTWYAGTMVPGSKETVKKQPAESITFGFDFSERLLAIGGALTGTPEVSSSPAGLTISEVALNSAKTAVSLRIAGGTSGTKYRITATVDHTNDDTFEIDGVLYVRNE